MTLLEGCPVDINRVGSYNMHLDLSTRSQVIGFTALGEVVTTTTDDPTSEKSTRLSSSQIVRTLKKPRQEYKRVTLRVWCPFVTSHSGGGNQTSEKSNTHQWQKVEHRQKNIVSLLMERPKAH